MQCYSRSRGFYEEEKQAAKNLQQLLQDLIVLCISSEKMPTDMDLLRLQRRYLRRKGAKQPFYTKSEILAEFNHTRAKVLKAEVQEKIRKFLQVKPVRTQSGVATITVLTKPWPCPGQCIFCPSEARMPKSYLANEPGAQRAEHNYFDPFLQVTSRLESLKQMGHDLSKVELIVLGGTWDSYPLPYQIWFIKRLYDALNCFGREKELKETQKFYQNLNEELRQKKSMLVSNDSKQNEKNWREWQEKLEKGEITYNQLMQTCYLKNWREKLLAEAQQAKWRQLQKAQKINQAGVCRNVGLVIETRPDFVTVENLTKLRRLGCTKVQIGVQSVNDKILTANKRNISRERQAEAFALLRLFGFKIHAHFMANLYLATPESDVADYREFMTSEDFLPDEVKIYPCSLLKSAKLMDYYHAGTWKPYTEEQLLQVLTQYLLLTPPFVRVTRMIRDISSNDIVVGNKKTNFRQLVEENCQRQGGVVREIRAREVRDDKLDLSNFRIEEIEYKTRVSQEYFLQYVNKDKRIVGFLRLSLPKKPADLILPEGLGEAAMIREVHVYGVVTAFKEKGNYQHTGFGRRLVNRAKEIARAAGYEKLKVIAAVGTREYYEKHLGFVENGLYHEIDLNENKKTCYDKLPKAPLPW